jgi:hypothetical protein
MIFFQTWGHTFFHFLNIIYATESTLAYFRNYLNPTFPMMKWGYASFFTGAVVELAMLIIFSAAPDVVRMSKYEIFFVSHHFFIVFYLFLFIHGPNTFIATIIPVTLYLYERYLQSKRGNKAFLVNKVEYIPPVMAVYFRPVNKVKTYYIFI